MAFKVNDVSFDQTFLYLQNSRKALTESINRLSAGKRITSAADDASGMTIADGLGSQARGIGQSLRNASDALAIAQVADGALTQSSELVQTIRVKALQAANASQTDASRQALQADIDSALKALDDIAQNTSYNGQKLLSGRFSSQSFQIGSYSGETMNVSIDNAEAQKLAAEAGGLANVNVLSAEGAMQAVAAADAALTEIDAIRGELGSTQNQLFAAMNNLSVTQINVASAESQISDLDFAEESMNFAKMQALMQAGVFAAAQGGRINKQNMVNLPQG